MSVSLCMNVSLYMSVSLCMNVSLYESVSLCMNVSLYMSVSLCMNVFLYMSELKSQKFRFCFSHTPLPPAKEAVHHTCSATSKPTKHSGGIPSESMPGWAVAVPSSVKRTLASFSKDTCTQVHTRAGACLIMRSAADERYRRKQGHALHELCSKWTGTHESRGMPYHALCGR